MVAMGMASRTEHLELIVPRTPRDSVGWRCNPKGDRVRIRHLYMPSFEIYPHPHNHVAHPSACSAMRSPSRQATFTMGDSPSRQATFTTGDSPSRQATFTIGDSLRSPQKDRNTLALNWVVHASLHTEAVAAGLLRRLQCDAEATGKQPFTPSA